MWTRWMAAAATLLLLLPLAAGAGPFASLQARRVRADGATLEGDLAGVTWFNPHSQTISSQASELKEGVVQDPGNTTFLQERAERLGATLQSTQPGVGSPEAIPVPFLGLQAGRARLATYHSEDYLYQRDPPSGSVPPPEVQAVDDLRIAGGGVGDSDSARVLVLPAIDGSAAARAQRVGDLQAISNPDDLAPTTQSEAGADYSMDLSHTVRVTSDASSVTVSGSFRLVIDAIDIPYSAADGDGTIRTRTEAHLPPAYYGATTVPTYSTVREAILDVWNATLVLDAGDLYVHRAVLSASSLDILGSTGQVAGRSVGDEPLHMQGDVVATVSSLDKEFMRVSLEGRMDLAIDGQPVAMPGGVAPDTSAAIARGTTSPLLLALLAVPFIPAAHWASSRRRFTRMDEALDRGDFNTALRLANRFTPWPGQRQDSILAAAICLLGLGRPAEACQRLEGRRWSAGRRPMRDFLRARGHAALGQVDAAVRALAASLLAEPGLIGQARTDPVLAALVDGPRDPSSSSQEAYA